MPFPIYQYVVNLVVSLAIRGGPGVFNNIYLLQLGCYPVAVVILHVNKT